LTDYRAFVVYHTSFLAGKNRAMGLYELDDKRVTVEERISAFNQFCKTAAKGEKKDPDIFAWDTYLINFCGHKELQTPSFLESDFIELTLQELKLAYANVTKFSGLQVLFSPPLPNTLSTHHTSLHRITIAHVTTPHHISHHTTHSIVIG